MTGCSLELKAKQTLSSMSCFSQSILSQTHKTHKNNLEQVSVIEIIEMCRQDIKLTEKTFAQMNLLNLLLTIMRKTKMN